jgi:hypothetical protein
MKIYYFLLMLSSVRALDTALPNLQQQPLKIDGVGDWFSSNDFDTFVKSTLDTWHVPGFSIAIVDGEKISAKVANHNLHYPGSI